MPFASLWITLPALDSCDRHGRPGDITALSILLPPTLISACKWRSNRPQSAVRSRVPEFVDAPITPALAERNVLPSEFGVLRAILLADAVA